MRKSLIGQHVSDNDHHHSCIPIEHYHHEDQRGLDGYPILHLDPSNIVRETLENRMKYCDIRQDVTRLDQIKVQFPEMQDLNVVSSDSEDLDEQSDSEMPLSHQIEARIINPTIQHAGIHDVIPEPVCFSYTRPEFLFVRVFKSSPKATLGMSFKRSRDGIYITRLESGGLLERANLRIGDRIVSVNGVSCQGLNVERIGKIIQRSRSEVSIVAHNKGGNAGLVSSSVQKPKRTDRVGIAFRTSREGIYMSKVKEDGLFAGSLLLKGHRCVMINDIFCDMVALCTAAQIISDTVDLVTITSQPQSDTAMVLACNH